MMLLDIEYEILVFISGEDRPLPGKLKDLSEEKADRIIAQMPRRWTDVLNYFPDTRAYASTNGVLEYLADTGAVMAEGDPPLCHVKVSTKGYRELAAYEQASKELIKKKADSDAHERNNNEFQTRLQEENRMLQERLQRDSLTFQRKLQTRTALLSGSLAIVGALVGAVVAYLLARF